MCCQLSLSIVEPDQYGPMFPKWRIVAGAVRYAVVDEHGFLMQPVIRHGFAKRASQSQNSSKNPLYLLDFKFSVSAPRHQPAGEPGIQSLETGLF